MILSHFGHGLRRIAGVLLIALVAFPGYRLLAYGSVGAIEADTMVAADRARALLLYGGLTVVLLTIVLAIVLGRLGWLDAVEYVAVGVAHRVTQLPQVPFVAGVAILGCVATAVFGRVVLDNTPNLMDSVAQLLHARYFAAGRLTAPAGVWSPFFVVQNSLTLPSGWVSQYPPGHIALLALGMLGHAVWLVGPVMLGCTVLFTALAAERLLPDDRGSARVAALLVALCPFLIGLAGAYMNHISAAAGISAAIYAAVRSRDDDSMGWAVITGVALGVVGTIRPLAAVTTGIVVSLAWVDVGSPATSWAAAVRSALRKLAAACVGALPLGVAMLIYDARVFGHPFRIGYMVANGPGMRLGFHLDPWGHWYGPLQALAYTSSDVTALSLNLLETPLPVVCLCGLYLLLARRLTRGIRVIALWAIVPVVANVFYWHHGIFMGPRMLNEVAPAWVLLTVVSVVGLVRKIPPAATIGSYSVRATATLLGVVTLIVGLGYLAPQRLMSYRSRSAIPMAARQRTVPTVVFVHGGWTARVAMRLIAAGMRLDSVETVLRKNPTCATDTFAKAYLDALPAQRLALVHTVDFAPGPPTHFERAEAAPGAPIRLRPGERLSVDCSREFLADRGGVLDVSLVAWAYDLPGVERGGAMFVRDLGPVENAEVLRHWPGRTPLFVYLPTPSAPPRLVAYDEGMAEVWH